MGLGRQRKHEEPSAGEHKSEDEVKVHVSFYGGLRVDPGELLRSKAAQDNIKKMCEVFGPRSLDASEAESRFPSTFVIPLAEVASARRFDPDAYQLFDRQDSGTVGPRV